MHIVRVITKVSEESQSYAQKFYRQDFCSTNKIDPNLLHHYLKMSGISLDKCLNFHKPKFCQTTYISDNILT